MFPSLLEVHQLSGTTSQRREVWVRRSAWCNLRFWQGNEHLGPRFCTGLGTGGILDYLAAIEQQHPFSDTWYHLSHPLLRSSLRKRPAYHFSGERVVPQHIQAQRQDPEQYQERVVLEENQKVKSWSQTLVAKRLGFHRFLFLKKFRLLTSGQKEYAMVLWCSVFLNFVLFEDGGVWQHACREKCMSV